MRRFKLFLFLLISTLALTHCKSKDKFHVDLSEIPTPNIEIKRYERAMFNLPQDSFMSSLPSLSSHFPVFLDGDLTDTFAVLALRSFFIDPFMVELFHKTDSVFPDLSTVENELSTAFQYFQYHFPEAMLPEVYTYVSGLDFKFPAKFIDKSLIISLDMYLGQGTKAYTVSGFPVYRTKWSVKEAIVPDAMSELAGNFLRSISNSDPLLNHIIYRGKIKYFEKAMIPQISDSLLFRYSQSQCDWAIENEANIWSYMIENQLIYSTDKRILRKFTEDGPFTDIFNKKSPARLADFIGFRIVDAFMNESGYSLNELMLEENSQKILKVSRYKPKF